MTAQFLHLCGAIYKQTAKAMVRDKIVPPIASGFSKSVTNSRASASLRRSVSSVARLFEGDSTVGWRGHRSGFASLRADHLNLLASLKARDPEAASESLRQYITKRPCDIDGLKGGLAR
jgi:hypothetical protein